MTYRRKDHATSHYRQDHSRTHSRHARTERAANGVWHCPGTQCRVGIVLPRMRSVPAQCVRNATNPFGRRFGIPLEIARFVLDFCAPEKKRDRCLWLGDGLSYAQPSTLGTGMGQGPEAVNVRSHRLRVPNVTLVTRFAFGNSLPGKSCCRNNLAPFGVPALHPPVKGNFGSRQSFSVVLQHISSALT